MPWPRPQALRVERGEHTPEEQLPALAAEIADRMRATLKVTPDIEWVDPQSFGRTGGAGVDVPPDSESPGARSRFMDVYAFYARPHMKDYGVTRRQIAAVPARNHRHSAGNPRAFFRKPFTVDDVLAAIIGNGAGRGYALTLLIVGILIVATAAVSWLDPRLRRVEDELPDAVDDSPAPAAPSGPELRQTWSSPALDRYCNSLLYTDRRKPRERQWLK